MKISIPDWLVLVGKSRLPVRALTWEILSPGLTIYILACGEGKKINEKMFE